MFSDCSLGTDELGIKISLHCQVLLQAKKFCHCDANPERPGKSHCQTIACEYYA